MKIACLIPGGLGGTQKAGWLFAAGLARLGHQVVGFSPRGPFVPSTPADGFSIFEHEPDSIPFSAIQDGAFDALHIHMPGYYICHPLYPWLKKLGSSRPRVVETNIFGRLQDWRSNGVTDFRLFISLTGACQAADRAWTAVSRLTSCGVARNPVDEAQPVSQDRIDGIRRRLGVEPGEMFALRLGRPDPAKWSDFECRVTSIVKAKRSFPMKLVAIEPPRLLSDRILAGEFGPAAKAGELIQAPAQVGEVISAADVIFHCARLGESFGYVIAEGMAASKPVITLTTPWGDNAQTELVENGVTGFVCCSTEGAAAALQILSRDSEMRRAMGEAGKARIAALADPATECRIVEAALMGSAPGLQQRHDEMLAYEHEFAKRQWEVIEKSHPDLMPMAGRVLAGAKRRAARMEFLKRASNVRADLRAFFGLPSFR